MISATIKVYFIRSEGTSRFSLESTKLLTFSSILISNLVSVFYRHFRVKPLYKCDQSRVGTGEQL